MKTYNRNYLPDSIEYKGEIFKIDIERTHKYKAGAKLSGKYHILVNVLSKNLKGRTDFHGNIYTPTQWIFSNEIGLLPTVTKPLETPAYRKAMKSIKTFGY